MANSTVATLISEVRFRVVPDSTSTDFDARCLSRINWTIENLIPILRIPEFETSETLTLATSVRSYTLATDWLATISLKNTTDSEPLELIGSRLESKLDEAETGRPVYWYRFGRAASIYPLPTSVENGTTLRHRYFKIPTRLLSTDSSSLPTQYDEAIILGASYRMVRDDNQTDRARAIFSEWAGLLKSMISIAGEEFLSSSQGIAPIMPLGY